MLIIKNYKKIKNQYFEDWQIGRIQEMNECYALQAFNANTKKSITMAILRDGEMCTEWNEIQYSISIIEDKTNNVIEDTIYKSVLEDMELFGESLVYYLNTL